MYDDRVAIAVWVPQECPDDRGLSAAASLASAGYTVIVPGSGPHPEGVCRAIFEAGQPPVSFRLAGQDAQWATIPGLRVEEHPDELSRIREVLRAAEAMVLLPGDVEVLASLMLVWAWGHRRDGAYRPVLLLGPQWPAILESLATASAMSKRTRAMVTLVGDAAEMISALRYCVSPTS